MKPIAKGFVLSVHKKTFWCRLMLEDKKQIEAQISIDKLTDREKLFLEEGAYVSILKGGSIRFNRLKWKRKDIEAAKKSANEKWEKIFTNYKDV